MDAPQTSSYNLTETVADTRGEGDLKAYSKEKLTLTQYRKLLARRQTDRLIRAAEWEQAMPTTLIQKMQYPEKLRGLLKNFVEMLDKMY